MPRTAFRVASLAAATATAALLGGCVGNYIGTGYATVPLQIVATSRGKFEILDRPEHGHLSISPCADQLTHWGAVEGLLLKTLTFETTASNRSTSPGSAYFDPLMEYFAQTGRSCRLIRGEPMIAPQWEFVYSCSPGVDASATTWNSSGFSNAPLPPPSAALPPPPLMPPPPFPVRPPPPAAR
jgi:hypothetical protein